jgi:DNA topoisomerase-2
MASSSAQASATYQRCTPVEHIKTRPDSYLGSVLPKTTTEWVFGAEEGRILQKEMLLVPGLFKIVDEILVNAIDQTKLDPTLDTIKVALDIEAGVICITNSGTGIPVVKHEEYGIYIQELIFGNLLTSSNFDDSEQRVTGGRNGFGAKLTNVFSTSFAVEIIDLERGLKYCQYWTDSMTKCSKPKVTRPKNPNHGYVKITFTPDLTMFGLIKMDQDFASLIHRRCFDACACTGPDVGIYFNGRKLPCPGFERYRDLVVGPRKEAPRATSVEDRWQVCVAASDSGFACISFVNGVSTALGGTHVDHVVSQVTKKVAESIQASAKGKGLIIRPAAVKQRLMFLVSAVLYNPTFSNQMKDSCTLRPGAFGSSFRASEELVAKIAGKLGVAEQIVERAREKEVKALSKSDGFKANHIKGIPKLEDAHWAGIKKSASCTLLLVEGDSAKTFAIAGLAMVGRKQFGIFPLKGKVLNVRDAPASQIAQNAEIGNLKKILGLKENHKYTSLSELRYGRVVTLCDADDDGTHIRGLLMNFFHCGWPELLKVSVLATIERLHCKTISERDKLFFNIKIRTALSKTPESYRIVGNGAQPPHAGCQGDKGSGGEGILHGEVIRGVENDSRSLVQSMDCEILQRCVLFSETVLLIQPQQPSLLKCVILNLVQGI